MGCCKGWFSEFIGINISNNLTLYLKKLEKETKPKLTIKGITKIRASSK